MSYTYRIYSEQQLVMINLSGDITGTTFIEAMLAFADDPKFRPGYDRIWDMTQITAIDMDFEDIKEHQRKAREIHDRMGAGRSVLVAQREAFVTISHLYRAMLPWQVDVARDLGAALALLGKQLPDAVAGEDA